MKFSIILAFTIFFTSCELFHPDPQIPSVPMIYFDFNENNTSSGIEDFKTFGNQNLSYKPGIKDSCLDLSITSRSRKPVIIKTKGDLMLEHQPQMAVMVWVKQKLNDLETYGIIGNKSIDASHEKGWIISTTPKGAWKLQLSDGLQNWEYTATPSRQRINDGKWHQLGFYINKDENMTYTYFDGQPVGILNMQNFTNFEADYHLHIGCNPGSNDYSKDAFNGMIDEIGIWSKPLSHEDFKNAYLCLKKEKLPSTEYAGETFKVLTWNIWNGGKQMGKTAGINQIVNVIKKSGADIVSLQEDFGAGQYISDKLGFTYYKCSENLSLLSRFPISKTHQIFRPLNIGIVQLLLKENDPILICPIWLSFTPNIKGMLANPEANQDTIINIEEKSRGSEVRFILSELKKFSTQIESGSIILAGDFNSGSHLDWTADNINNKYNKVIPFPTSILLEENNYTDAYRQIWPGNLKKQGNTYSPIFKEGYNDRIDFVYYKGTTIEAIDASVIDKTDSFFPSDHAALLITFKRKQK
ncbi:endonuclease/exonuclease/phosphatase family protein [Plebeiibacterium marinum]|uniref:Endonuclease/exonuclease/phosphatase family protein n=1 Tax=Plebeiibacterium marinum TaxID=2992111 RepID=A0AAE3SLH9_9BACT|nr:endonuclease/exonuclease/phosphatase family protein [Plebeiobacterium marinum]MCW3806575.1 endonuclease/exonuclease/phosphatase family protein [Plebeiobacterium marinum]